MTGNVFLFMMHCAAKKKIHFYLLGVIIVLLNYFGTYIEAAINLYSS
jgi:hypothetical protein